MGSHNHIVHAEVVGRDGEKLQRFYTDLFGWSLDTNNPGGYGTPDGSAGFATFYVAVDDVDAALDKATSLGGSVVMPKYSPAPGIELALAADPEGHVVGLTKG